MASVKDCFEIDFSHTVSMTLPLELSLPSIGPLDVVSRVHLDFTSKAMFSSFYLASPNFSTDLAIELVDQINQMWGGPLPSPINIRLPSMKLFPGDLQISKDPFSIAAKFFGGPPTSHSDLHYLGRIYVYTETDFSESEGKVIGRSIENQKLDPQFRGPEFALRRTKAEQPVAFISHDSRDKDSIARPIALGLNRNLLNVWYDEYSLPVGAKLRESIEGAIKECKKCILVVTPHFLNNQGWTKAEFDSVFTKEIIKKGNVLLPVWHEVSPEEVYDYSPWLANIRAVNWSVGEQEVIRQLMREIESR